MNNYWLFLLLEAKNQKKRGSLEQMTQLQLRSMFHQMEEVSKVQHLICLDKTSPRCSMSSMKIKVAKKNLSGKLLGASQQDQLGP